eukprot:Lithocolla_globosa_v1_NODE_1183_length_2804_cov_4.231721.p2 type:complete len:107 gc:universal NODE_1183_length_2804_cov_4.231721:1901-2221(+)
MNRKGKESLLQMSVGKPFLQGQTGIRCAAWSGAGWTLWMWRCLPSWPIRTVRRWRMICRHGSIRQRKCGSLAGHMNQAPPCSSTNLSTCVTTSPSCPFVEPTLCLT